MAKTNGRDDPPKPQVTENEQMSDIVFILDKMELILQAVSEINKDGRFKTVPADKEHQNSFLKIDRYANLFENFLKNFWSQLKDPTRFGILTVKEDTLDIPEVRQAVEDMAAGKQTKAVEEFLKKYEIVPRDKENQSINQKNQEEMAKKNETTQQAVQEGGQQQPKYRYNESMINWEELKNFGLSREYLQERGLLDQMLRGYKTNQVVPISMNFGSAVLRTDARLSFQQTAGGQIALGIHGIRQKPELDRPYFGHIFSEEDKKNLLETGNMGRVVELKGRNGEYIPSFVSIDKLTNEVVAMRAENAFIPREIKGVQLTEQEQNDLREGKKVFIEGMISNSGKEFDAHIQINAERRGVEFIFENDKLFNCQSLGGVELTKQQIEDLNMGKAIFVEGMERKDGEIFSSYVKLDEATGRPAYTRYNPDSPEGAREICTPVRDKKIVYKKLVVSQIFCTFLGELQQVANLFNMTADCKVTELFCIIDEFCKHFDAENAGNLLEDNSGVKRRRRAASLSDSEIMTILLYFHFGTFRNFKHYYLFFIKVTMKSYFPKAVSYNRFVELESRVFFQLMFFLNLGAFGKCTGITFVDSTMIPVCHNPRRYANKVFKGLATRWERNDGLVSRLQTASCMQ